MCNIKPLTFTFINLPQRGLVKRWHIFSKNLLIGYNFDYDDTNIYLCNELEIKVVYEKIFKFVK